MSFIESNSTNLGQNWKEDLAKKEVPRGIERVDFHLRDGLGRMYSLGAHRETRSNFNKDMPTFKSINSCRVSFDGDIKGVVDIPLTSFTWDLPEANSLEPIEIPSHLQTKNEVSVF